MTASNRIIAQRIEGTTNRANVLKVGEELLLRNVVKVGDKIVFNNSTYGIHSNTIDGEEVLSMGESAILAILD